MCMCMCMYVYAIPVEWSDVLHARCARRRDLDVIRRRKVLVYTKIIPTRARPVLAEFQRINTSRKFPGARALRFRADFVHGIDLVVLARGARVARLCASAKCAFVCVLREVLVRGVLVALRVGSARASYTHIGHSRGEQTPFAAALQA